MQLDKSALDRLLSLDDITLAKAINSIASAAGVNPEAAKAATENLRLVRASLSNATEADIQKAAAMFGKERTEELVEKLSKSGDGQ